MKTNSVAIEKVVRTEQRGGEKGGYEKQHSG